MLLPLLTLKRKLVMNSRSNYLVLKQLTGSRDGNKLAFIAYNSLQSDVYIYDFHTKNLTNLTNDLYSETDPIWTPDGKKLFFHPTAVMI